MTNSREDVGDSGEKIRRKRYVDGLGKILGTETWGYKLHLRNALSYADNSVAIPEKIEKNTETLEVSDRNMHIPKNVIESIQQEKAKNKSAYFYAGLNDMRALAGSDDISAEESEKPPFSLLATDTKIFINSTVAKSPDHPDSAAQICTITFDLETGKIRQLHRHVPLPLLRVFLSQCPSFPLLDKIKSAFHAEDPTDDDRRQYEKIIAETAELQQCGEELRAAQISNTKFLYENLQNSPHIHTVLQNEYAVATKDQTRWLATFGAGPCYIIAIAGNGKAGLAHVDASTDGIRTLELLRYQLNIRKSDHPHERFTVTLAGGDSGTTKDVVNTYKRLQQWQKEGLPIDIRIGAIFQGTSESMAIDIETGETSSFIPLQRMTEEVRQRMLMSHFFMMEAAFSGKQPARPHHPKSKQ